MTLLGGGERIILMVRMLKELYYVLKLSGGAS
jgi:hypothetical protein